MKYKQIKQTNKKPFTESSFMEAKVFKAINFWLRKVGNLFRLVIVKTVTDLLPSTYLHLVKILPVYVIVHLFNASINQHAALVIYISS